MNPILYISFIAMSGRKVTTRYESPAHAAERLAVLRAAEAIVVQYAPTHSGPSRMDCLREIEAIAPRVAYYGFA